MAIGVMTAFALSLNPAGWITWAVAGVLGTIGGMMGSERASQENKIGKVVEKPTLFNKEMLLGILFAGVLTSIAIAVAVPVIIPAVIPDVIAIIGVLGIPSTALCAWVFGDSGKNRMASEYAQAVQQNDQKDLQKGTYIANQVQPTVVYKNIPDLEQTKENGTQHQDDIAARSADGVYQRR